MPALDNQEILKRILEQPELTEQDQQWLLRYLESSDQPELEQLLREHFEKSLSAGSTLQDDISGKLLQGIHNKLAIEPAVNKRPIVKMVLVRAAVAAAVVALVITSFYFLSNKPQPANTITKVQPAPAVQQVAEAKPGTNGAIITFSDGSTIELDSLKDGALKANIVKKGNQVIYKEQAGEPVYNTVSTPRGRQYQLVLADGSKVWLNAASSIRFPTTFTGNDRTVEVTGELYFEVAKNASKPFKVIANGTEIEVLGTHFNVDSYDEVIKTTLLEGSVKIKAGDKTGLLRPGQQSQASTAGEFKTTSSVDIDKVMAWKNGRFSFENASLESIMNQVSRWYDVDVVYQDKVPKRFFTADISRNNNLSVFLKVLAESGIRFKMEGKKLLVQP
jgi:transmembrane sensor